MQTQRLALTVAPHIDIDAIRRLTRPYRLFRRLMDQETVMRLLGPQNGRALYELTQDSCDWNARYWEQRALFESELGQPCSGKILCRAFPHNYSVTHSHLTPSEPFWAELLSKTAMPKPCGRPSGTWSWHGTSVAGTLLSIHTSPISEQ